MRKLALHLKWQTNSVLRYLVVGTWNTVFSVGVLYFLFYLFDSRFYELELAATFVLSTTQSYTTQRFVVWKSAARGKKEFFRFIIATVSQYLLNSILLYLAVHIFKFKPTYAALPILLTLTCGFYFVNRNIVFKSS
jgi:putative flippase GtrA